MHRIYLLFCFVRAQQMSLVLARLRHGRYGGRTPFGSEPPTALEMRNHRKGCTVQCLYFPGMSWIAVQVLACELAGSLHPYLARTCQLNLQPSALARATLCENATGEFSVD
jgi:hypothetical protein